MDNKEKIDKNKIVIVSGDGKDLDISKVYDHINIDESNNENSDKKTVIIPTEKK